ncbi:hypothetical protein D3C71_2017350 [compost metagenome]
MKEWKKANEYMGYEIQILQNAEIADEFSYRVKPPVLIAENGKSVTYDSMGEAIDSIDKYAAR